MKKLLMGNEAIAYAAVNCGVNLVCGYPGTPSTEVLETVAKIREKDTYVEWSINEKVAMEIGGGAAYAGARVMVTMKQMGLNVAGDPLMCLSYIGVKGGMVILVADDPGPISSQTEQDTRHYGIFSKLPVFDPSTPEEAYAMTQDAFALSEQTGLPVLLRPTTRICHACASIELPEQNQRHPVEGFVKDPKWVIFPPLSYRKHIELEGKNLEIARLFSASPYNRVEGKGPLAVFASGAAYGYAKEALAASGHSLRLVKLGCAVPFPEDFALKALEGVQKVLVAEELDPVIEEALYRLKGKYGLPFELLGKRTGHMPYAGEYSVPMLKKAFAAFGGWEVPEGAAMALPPLPTRPPVLCAGCPHRASFYAVKQAMKGQKAVFSGDIGCYTLGNAKPLDMTDTCLCMGAGVTIAQGLSHVEDGAHFAFIGDSTFFHSGITGLANAVYNEADVNIVILDNSTTAMTGHQPHPGTGNTMMGKVKPGIDIAGLCRACGAEFVETADPLNLEQAVDVVRRANAHKGVSVIIFKSPCIALNKASYTMAVNANKCVGCKKCIREIGCPAIFPDGKKVRIDGGLCYGCNLCAQVCPTGAIGKKEDA